jgi:predicted TIM-barrel fold metal-dependent hydrolase
MKKIDGHIHIGKWGSVFYNYETNVQQAIDVMNEAGITAAICMPASDEPNIILLNECYDRSDFKFYFASWIDPEDRYLESFLNQNLYKISCFKFHPSFQKIKITDDAYKIYLKLAEDNNKPVIIHCGRWKEIADYHYPLELVESYPELKIILAHLGGDQPGLYLECAKEIKKRNLANVYVGTESIREFYFVNEVVNILGADKIIFGSDYNLGLPQMYFPVIDSLKITEEEREMIYSGNILRLLNDV